ncbi:DUF6992 family protein [Hymenobacter artigasi]|uniref:Uncharacterized protein n=1 Tax=Hymenobacter artigasi TaxID=2719616 RepID=A0ABX1HHB1_9BACT|nr:hypothetical protein [Hymenobacter artigasi]NKI88421.1 hypothetical protein [Hymenobacter artigasi]
MPASPAAVDIASLFMTRELLLGRGLAVLAAWVLLNLVGSGYYLAHSDRRHESFYFHGMNVGWGLVNAGLAAWGILQLHFVAPAGLVPAELLQSQLFNENLFLLNAGLDVAYIMTGYYLRARALVPGQALPVRLLGFGRSLWVQGGFLLVFDATMWSLLHWLGRDWFRLLG